MLPIRIHVEDPSQSGEARRQARKLAAELGFNDVQTEQVALVVTEAATNLLKHAGRGEIFLQAGLGDPAPLELLALDQGPGIQDVRASWRDGFSTSGTFGVGLGAVERNSSFCDLYSVPGHGTALLARFLATEADRPAPAALPARLGALQAAKPGQQVCGDAWSSRQENGRQVVVVADGLGHGPEANLAACTAVGLLDQNVSASPRDLLEIIHLGLRHTRGAAVAIAELDWERRIVVFAGLGNIGARICEGDSQARHLVSLNGTAGMENRTSMREFQYPWPEGAMLILHSDGLTGRWELNQYPALMRRDAGLICGVLFRDFSRHTDDATVVAVK